MKKPRSCRTLTTISFLQVSEWVQIVIPHPVRLADEAVDGDEVRLQVQITERKKDAVGWQLQDTMLLTLTPGKDVMRKNLSSPKSMRRDDPGILRRERVPELGPPMSSTTMTSPSAWRSLHHCSPRSEKMQRAVDELITIMTKVCRPVSRRLSVIERGENEQIRIFFGTTKREDSR